MNCNRILDVRGLEPPEPMVRVLEAIDSLLREEVLCMVHNREPFPLYPVLAEQGYAHSTTVNDEGYYEIRIWRR